MLESRRIRIKQQDMNDVLDKLLGPLSNHNSVQAAAVALQNDFEDLVLENQQLRAKACKGKCNILRFALRNKSICSFFAFIKLLIIQDFKPDMLPRKELKYLKI